MEAHAAHSPLVAARLRRRLTVEEAAARASLDVDAVKSIEESRTYVFPSTADAIATAVVYASSLGITEREARELAGLPVESVVERWSLQRWALVLSFIVALAALMIFVLRPQFFPDGPPAAPPAPAAKTTAVPAEPLPERWEIQVDVYNGTTKGNAASGMANELAGLAYRIGTVKNADRRTYDETRVYYPPGGEAIAERLAEELGVGTTALPGGDDPLRLVVIVGRRG
jgi:transcriptional regulator with XRE-family HTH domain